ncbi:dienelactone hydrolase family protein [Metabacillus niabensis]|uniref:dienelactone hydrolase family protein n=1 Tax=Metabacillus niabensis TaxID=324854 RepID=UPI001CFB4989|nr:dienelactone hydrolase family protein [Metabacillus niabensis]
MKVRRAIPDDITDLASLMEQLGYPTSIEQMNIRFNQIEKTSNHYTFRAENDDKVVGIIGFHTGVLTTVMIFMLV